MADLEVFRSCLKQCLSRPDVALALAKAAIRHRQVEKEFRRRFAGSFPPEMRLQFPHLELAPYQYWQRNFFSILFISVFDALGIPADRCRSYGLILHAVRGIVTAADNILDHENKGAVRFAGREAAVLPNVLLILMQNGLIHEVLHEAMPEADTRKRAAAALMRALSAIALEECGEENGVETVLPPDELLAEICHFRGGELLRLAFVVPEVGEAQLADKWRMVGAAINRIGVALQVVDDITDFAEDITRRHHNVLRSCIVHRGPDGAVSDASLSKLPAERLAHPERDFPRATSQMITLALNLALEGFEHLHRAGHAIDRASALELIKMLFHLRGLRRLWALVSIRNSDDQAADSRHQAAGPAAQCSSAHLWPAT